MSSSFDFLDLFVDHVLFNWIKENKTEVKFDKMEKLIFLTDCNLTMWIITKHLNFFFDSGSNGYYFMS